MKYLPILFKSCLIIFFIGSLFNTSLRAQPGWSNYSINVSNNLNNAASANIGVSMYRFGGYIGSPVNIAFNNCQSFDQYGTYAITPMPTARGHAMAETGSNGKIYVIGGINSSGALAVVEEYDSTTNTWTTKTSAPHPVYNAASCQFNNQIYIIGGGFPGSPAFSSIVYDIATDSWTVLANMPTARLRASAAGFNYLNLNTNSTVPRIYVAGGTVDNLNALTKLEYYDINSNSWGTASPLPAGLFDFGFESDFNNLIFILGGMQTAGPADAVTTYHPNADSHVDCNCIDLAQPFQGDVYGSYLQSMQQFDLLHASSSPINQFGKMWGWIVLAEHGFTLDANPNDQHVNLNWTFEESLNPESFSIEKSKDGKQFESIGNLTADQYKTDYQFLDLNPLSGLNYYRIKIIDQSGNTSFSDIETANFGGVVIPLSLYPNPVTEKFELSLDPELQNLKFEMIDQKGSIIQLSGLQMYPGQYKFDLTAFPPGVYFLKINSNGQLFTEKVVKL